MVAPGAQPARLCIIFLLLPGSSPSSSAMSFSDVSSCEDAHETLLAEHAALRRTHEATLAELRVSKHRITKLRAGRAALYGLVTDRRALRQASHSAENSRALGNRDIAVRRSGIQGAERGAFARRSFAAGELVGRYLCRVVQTNSQMRDGLRSWRVNSTHSCDGSMFPLHNPMLYVNSVASNETCHKRNVKAKFRHGSVRYVATKARARFLFR